MFYYIGDIMPTPFIFNEQKNQVFYHDLKVFIFGTDVTPWITGAVSVQYSDRDGTNVLSFQLANQYRAFEITRENLGETPEATLDANNNFKVNQNGKPKSASNFRLTDPYTLQGMYSELAKAKIYKLKTQANRNTKLTVKTKGPVVSIKQPGKIKKITDDDWSNSSDDTTTRYPMSIGSLVFHKYDPVRFFVKNPLTSNDDQWYCAFTGYLDTKPFSQNYTNGESVISISCQDIRVMLGLMRVQQNPNAQISNENMIKFGTKGGAAGNTIDAGFFNDFIIHKTSTHILGGANWFQSVSRLLFGVQTNGAWRGGVGKLKKGLTLYYNPAGADKFKVLEKWNNIINFGTTPLMVNADVQPLVPQGSLEADPTSFELFPTSAAEGNMSEGTFLTKAQMYALGTSTVPDKAGSPDAAKVHFLLPAEGTPNQNMIEYNVAERIDVREEWVTRLELLGKLVKSLDYQMYVTGMGDIVFEFPMYDFFPTDYTGYDQLYIFKDHIVSDNINDEGGSAISALEVTSIELFQSTQDPTKTPGAAPLQLSTELRKTIFSNVLASRIGPIIETYSVPGVTDQNKLAQLGYVEFNKRISNFNLFDMNVAFRPWIGINRPIYHQIKERFGITKSLTYTWRIREDVTLEMSLQYTRKREGDGKFRFITGGERQPISYRSIFGGCIVPDQGVNATPDSGNAKPKQKTSQTKTSDTEANI